MKKYKIRAYIVLQILFLCFTFYYVWYTRKSKDETLDTKYFSVTVPTGWSLKSNDEGYFSKLVYNQEDAITIEVFKNISFDSSIKSIVANIYGVHAYVKEVQYTKKLNTSTLSKTYITFEQSASEEYNNTIQSDELHYFYINNNNNNNILIDLHVISSSINQTLIENIAKSLTLKN